MMTKQEANRSFLRAFAAAAQNVARLTRENGRATAWAVVCGARRDLDRQAAELTTRRGRVYARAEADAYRTAFGG